MLGSFFLFGKEISWYMIAALIGGLGAGTFAYIKSMRKGLDEVRMVFLLLFAMIGIFVGGHIVYGITNIDKFWLFTKIQSFDSFITVVSYLLGGQVFYGGLLGGIAAGAIYAKASKLENFSAYTDILAVAVPFFHFFGRIGCFLGGCCYGIESDFGFTFHNSLIVSANGVNRFPVQLFEAGFNLVLAAVMLIMLNKGKIKGRLFLVYMYVYAIGRFILEYFRGDEYRGYLFGLSTSQIISVLILIALTVYFFIARIAGKGKSVNTEKQEVSTEN